MLKTSDFKEVPPCFNPGMWAKYESAELHEIIHGNGVRKIAEKYHIQVALCRTCHDLYQGDKLFSKRVCEFFGVPYDDLYRIIKHKAERDWTEQERKLVIDSGEKIKAYYERYH